MSQANAMKNLTLAFNLAENGYGEFLVRVNYNGFAGIGSCFLEVATLVKAAADFALYPLPSDTPVCIEGGYFFDNSNELEQVHVQLSAHSSIELGGPALTINLAMPFDLGVSQYQSRLTCLLPITYEQLKDIAEVFGGLAARHSSEYVLEI